MSCGRRMCSVGRGPGTGGEVEPRHTNRYLRLAEVDRSNAEAKFPVVRGAEYL
jgi:hypothetical protein